MAIGDRAAAKGLKVYTSAQDRRLGFENDNQRGDEIADTMDRLDNVEKFINQPIFSTYRGAVQSAPHTLWTTVAGAFAVPDLNIGFTSWNGGTGVLTVLKPGVYRIFAHVQFIGSYTAIGVQVTRNTASPDTENTLAKGETAGPGAEGSTIRRLAKGDALRFLVLQRNSASEARAIGGSSFDLGYGVEWVRD